MRNGFDTLAIGVFESILIVEDGISSGITRTATPFSRKPFESLAEADAEMIQGNLLGD